MNRIEDNAVWNIFVSGMQYLLSSLQYLLILSQFTYSESSTNSNFKNIIDFNLYLESHFARENTLTEEEWVNSLPNEIEKHEMKQLVSYLFHLKSFSSINSTLLLKFPSLAKHVNITVLDDCCVIYEQTPKDGKLFARNWGYFAISHPHRTLRRIHHSVAHFESDGCVVEQGVHLFHSTRSRSLVVAGASRYAVRGNFSSPCQQSFRLSDAAHNCGTTFHTWNSIIHDLETEEQKREERKNGHFFVQWHGMAETSCHSSDVFISAGVGSSSVYEQDIPAERLNTYFNHNLDLSKMKSSTPRSDGTCKLTGSTNVFGRYVNGVEAGKVCTQSALKENVHGRFVHIEQKAKARSAYNLWTKVIQEAFPV